MGDYRITVEAIGGHGCGRSANDGEAIARCGQSSCPDCKAIAFVNDLRSSGNSVAKAIIEHWPVPGAAGCMREEKAGPIDDLLTGIRHGAF